MGTTCAAWLRSAPGTFYILPELPLYLAVIKFKLLFFIGFVEGRAFTYGFMFDTHKPTHYLIHILDIFKNVIGILIMKPGTIAILRKPIPPPSPLTLIVNSSYTLHWWTSLGKARGSWKDFEDINYNFRFLYTFYPL